MRRVKRQHVLADADIERHCFARPAVRSGIFNAELLSGKAKALHFANRDKPEGTLAREHLVDLDQGRYR
jgi:hypothetical protein